MEEIPVALQSHEDCKKVYLNPVALDAIKNATNPQILVVNGTTRYGKSTTLNQIIRGYKKKPLKYICRKPFTAKGGDNSVTVGTNLYGPIKLSKLVYNCGLEDDIKINEEDEADIFLVDTEGFKSLNNLSAQYIPAILTLIQVSTLCIFLTKGLPDQGHIEDIKNHALLSQYMSKAVQNHGKCSEPLFYVTDYKLELTEENVENGVHNDNDNEEEDEDEEEVDNEEIIKSLNQIRYDVKNSITEKIRNIIDNDETLNSLSMLDLLNVVISGPFRSDQLNVPSNDPYIEVYWNSIQDIVSEFNDSINRRGHQSGEHLYNLITTIFNVFSRMPSIPNNETEFEEIIKSIFESIFTDELNNINQNIEKDMDDNFDYCKNIVINNPPPKEIILKYIEEESKQTYEALIEDFMNSELERISSLLLNKASNFVNSLVDKFCISLRDEKKIYIYAKNMFDIIERCEFKDDIPKSLYSDEQRTNILANIQNDNKYYSQVAIYMQQYQDARYKDTMDLLLKKIDEKIKEKYDPLPFWPNFKNEEYKKISQIISSEYKSQGHDYKYFKKKFLNQLEYHLNDKRRQDYCQMIFEIYNSYANNSALPPPPKKEEAPPAPQIRVSWLKFIFSPSLWKNESVKVTGVIFNF